MKNRLTGDFLTLRSRGAEAAEFGEPGVIGPTGPGVMGLLAALRTLDGESMTWGTTAGSGPASRPRVIGWSVPLGSRKQGVLGAGRPGAAKTEAPLTREYGTMRIGLVGRARQGCGWEEGGAGGGESPGLELVGGEPFSDDADAPLDERAAVVGPSLTTCLVLQ